MARTWILDTQTKGTGATMVPLESVLRKPGSDRVPGFKIAPLKEPADEAGRPPLVFKVTDVVTREVLAEGVDPRAAADALADVRSIVDVAVSAWDSEAERWRLLSLEETRLLWRHRPERVQG